MIARILKNDEGESIHVPTQADKAARDLLRCHEDIRQEAHRTKLQLVRFLAHNGYIYETKRQMWTEVHRDWMKRIEFRSELQEETFTQYW